jgi:hypothetical protein
LQSSRPEPALELAAPPARWPDLDPCTLPAPRGLHWPGNKRKLSVVNGNYATRFLARRSYVRSGSFSDAHRITVAVSWWVFRIVWKYPEVLPSCRS